MTRLMRPVKTRSVCAAAQSRQSSLGVQWVIRVLKLLHAGSKDRLECRDVWAYLSIQFAYIIFVGAHVSQLEIIKFSEICHKISPNSSSYWNWIE